MKQLINRYSSMFPDSLSLFLSFCFIFLSCQHINVVEKKNDKGMVIERYHTITNHGVEVKDGTYERFDEQGRLAEQSNYKSGKLEGLRKLYHDGILESEETRVADEFNGPFKSFHPNGKLQMEANYIHDVMSGDVKVYYPTGQLKEIVRFAGNAEDGPFTEFYENGKLKAEGQYKQLDGPVENGELKLYDTTGNLIRIMNCELGKCSTKWVKDSTSYHSL